MEIKRVPISEVEVWDKNPRNIKTKDFERLKRQIQELGVYKPLICFRENGKYTTLGGNMRLRALKDLSINEIDISIVKPKTEAQKIKYALSDNDRVGQYDEQALAELAYPHIEEINLEDYKLDIGEPISLKDVIEDYAPDIDGEDEIPEIDDSPAITKMGDLFTLGKHRLLCGDATKEEDVKRLMGGEKADMVFTDPPYNSLTSWGKIKGKKETKLNPENWFEHDNLKPEEYQTFLNKFIAIINSQVKRGATFYICIDWRVYHQLFETLLNNGHYLKHLIVWDKEHYGLGWKYRLQHEFLTYSTQDENQIKFYGGHGTPDIWRVRRTVEGLHNTQKPVGLSIKALKHSSKAEDLIIDSFLGSGTTLIACEKFNRICYGMEIEPKYCDVIITRYANFTDTPGEEIRATKENG